MTAIVNGALAAFVPVALLSVAFAGLLQRLRVLSVSIVCAVVLGAYGAKLGISVTGNRSLLVALLFGATCGATAGFLAALLDARFVGRGGFLALLSSLGALKAVQGLIVLLEGGGVAVLPVNLAPQSGLGVLDFPSWLTTGLVVLLGAAVLQVWLLNFTTTGLAATAVGDDPELASLFAIAPIRVFLTIEGVGGAIAGAAGVILGVEGGLRPDLGLGVALKSFGVLIAAGDSYAAIFLWAAILVGLEQLVGFSLGGQLREAAGLLFLVHTCPRSVLTTSSRRGIMGLRRFQMTCSTGGRLDDTCSERVQPTAYGVLALGVPAGGSAARS